MKKQIITALCVTGLVLSIQAQPSSGGSGSLDSPGASSTNNSSMDSTTTGSGLGSSAPDTTSSSIPGVASTNLALGSASDLSGAPHSNGTLGATSSSSSKSLSPTGRSYQKAVRGSKIMGAAVQNSQGQTIGTIEDVLLSPTSGQLDFAVISLDSSAIAASSSSNSSLGGSTASIAGDRLVAVPWNLIRQAGPASSSATPSSSDSTIASAQVFVFSGDMSKLQAAPSFSGNNWPDATTSEWRQSIYTHYGTQGSATGASSSPSGIGSGSDSESSGASQSPGGTSSGSSGSDDSSGGGSAVAPAGGSSGTNGTPRSRSGSFPRSI